MLHWKTAAWPNIPLSHIILILSKPDNEFPYPINTDHKADSLRYELFQSLDLLSRDSNPRQHPPPPDGKPASALTKLAIHLVDIEYTLNII